VIAVDAVPPSRLHLQEPEADEGTTAYCSTPRAPPRRNGVMISHLNLPPSATGAEFPGGTEGDRGCMWLPFFHDMGLITALLAPVMGQSSPL